MNILVCEYKDCKSRDGEEYVRLLDDIKDEAEELYNSGEISSTEDLYELWEDWKDEPIYLCEDHKIGHRLYNI